MTIAIGNDHVGYQLKQIIIPLLESKGYTVKDFGCFTGDEIRQYPGRWPAGHAKRAS